MTEEKQSKYAEKISMLLAKAESTTPEEAESIMVTVQRLMVEYAITEQMIAKAQGKRVQEQIIDDKLVYTGMFMATTMNIAFAVADNNNCRAFYSKHDWAKPKNHTVHIFGFESDVNNVKLMAMSLEVQMAQAMLHWSKTAPEMSASLSKMARFKARREFIMGFTNEIGGRLYRAQQEGVDAAAKAEAERTNVAVAVASDSVALVLRDRKSQVNDWFDTRYGRSLRTVAQRYSSGGAGAHSAGAAAGRTANIGQPSVGGGGKSLGRGK